MKLYGAARGVNPRRVRIFLAEKGITDVEHINLDLKAGENLSPEFRKKNPLGKVPVLELDDGTLILESIAICRYFEALYPEPNLMGIGARETAEIEMWTRIVEFEMQQAASMAFRHILAPFADREPIVREWGEINRDKLEKMTHFLDGRLEKHEFIAADRYTIADICALCALEQGVHLLKLEFDESRANLLRWYEAMKARPSYRA